MSAGPNRYDKYFEDPNPLFSQQAMAATRTSRSFGVSGYNTLDLYGLLDTRVSMTHLVIQVFFQIQNDNTNWYPLTSVSVAAGAGTRATYTDTTPLASTGATMSASFPIKPNVKNMRITITGTASAAGDLMTMRYALSRVSA